MITIDPQISDYIDLAIERQRVIFNGDMQVRFKEQEEKIDVKLKEQDSRMDVRFKEQDIKMDARFKEQDSRMDVRFKEQDIKMDAKFKEQDKKLDAKFKEQDKRIDAKFKEQDSSITAKFKEQDSKIEVRFKGQDTNIDSKLNTFNVDSERHMGMLLEEFQDRLQIVKEWIKDLPTREEVRTMIQDETNPIRRDLTLLKVEIINLRKVSSNHDIRIARLEQKTA